MDNKNDEIEQLLKYVKGKGDLFSRDILYRILVRYEKANIDSKKHINGLRERVTRLEAELSRSKLEMGRLSLELEVFKK
jgi:hypothetical protein